MPEVALLTEHIRSENTLTHRTLQLQCMKDKMFATKAKRFFSTVKFGLPKARFYLKNKATQDDLDEMIREIIRREPGLEKAHTASLEYDFWSSSEGRLDDNRV